MVYEQMCTKKAANSHKVPQRGPGVAELEKILREQRDQNSSVSAMTLVPKHSHLIQKLDFQSNASFLPTMWRGNASKPELARANFAQMTDESDLNRPSKKNTTQMNSMMSHYPPQPTLPRSFLTSDGPNHRMTHNLAPMSLHEEGNHRMTHNLAPMSLHEEEMVGLKRQWPTRPFIRYEVSQFSAQLNRPDLNIPEQPYTSSNQLTSNSDLISRDRKRRCLSSEHGRKNSNEKSLYNFLQPKEKNKCNDKAALNSDNVEDGREETLDLTLKL